jgi:hypothetical protein
LKMFYTTKEIIGNCPKMNRLKNINLFVKITENRWVMHHNLGCVCPGWKVQVEKNSCVNRISWYGACSCG